MGNLNDIIKLIVMLVNMIYCTLGLTLIIVATYILVQGEGVGRDADITFGGEGRIIHIIELLLTPTRRNKRKNRLRGARSRLLYPSVHIWYRDRVYYRRIGDAGVLWGHLPD